MSQERSFTEYISATRYNEMFNAIKRYIYANQSSLELQSNIVDNIKYTELSEIYVKLVTVDELPGNVLAFDIIIESDIEVRGKGRRDWETDLCSKWFIISCTATLSLELSDFKILKTEPYNKKHYRENPLSDALVPCISADNLDNEAVKFLKKYYPEALQNPMPLDTKLLTQRMGLKLIFQQLTGDFSVFGQIIFADTDTEVFDTQTGEMVLRHFEAGTVVVDPQTFHLRNLGSVHNTIVHECVHWDRHRKAFELERLYNASATQIKCIVIGGVKSNINRNANDWMEWQANALTPRIQMPITPFKMKANEFIRKFRRYSNADELVDVMEPVIDALAEFFCVSRCAAKIRMVDAGYQEAIGAFTYIDDHYVKPHAFKKGSIEKNQTYSISLDDALFETLINQKLQNYTQRGDFVYVDSHVCLNDPKYITRNSHGEFEMTDYGRLHIDECCLAFKLKVKHANKYGEQFYKECVLYRDANSGLHFEAQFAPENSKTVLDKANAIAALNSDVDEILSVLPTSFNASLVKLMDWVEISVEELAENSKLSSKTIQRMRTQADYNVGLRTVIAVCIGMHLHPVLSQHLLNAAGLSFRYNVPEQAMYHFFITAFYMHSIDECNEILVARGHKKLSGDE